jgi:hypothetical protein
VCVYILEDLSFYPMLNLKHLFARKYLIVRRIVLLDLCPILY